jgi:group I intron endonuclease
LQKRKTDYGGLITVDFKTKGVVEMNKKKNKSTNGIIYKATNKTNKMIYIGMTTKSLEERKLSHYNTSKNSSYSHLEMAIAIKTFGIDGFKWEIIDFGNSKRELCQKEIYWIEYYDSFSEFGYNRTTGGAGAKGTILTDEARKKISDHSKTRIGSKNAGTKLHEDDVIKIVGMIKEGKAYKEIGKAFDVSTNVVWSIASGKTWRHVVSDEDLEEIIEMLKDTGRVSPRTNTKMTEEIAYEVKKLLLIGEKTLIEIAEVFNIRPAQVTAIKNLANWAKVKLSKEDIKAITLLKEQKRKEERQTRRNRRKESNTLAK